MEFQIEGLLLFIVLSITGTLSSIDRVELLMPKYAPKGGDVILKCDHSVPPDQLHKVVWKKGDSKIFSYIKGRTPPFQALEMEGAKLNASLSSEKQVYLSNLDFTAGGSYYCVVSMETPSIFTKDSEKKDLTIIELQQRDPEIFFEKKLFLAGEKIVANCTTAPARPPPHITWLINNNKVKETYTKSFSNGVVLGRGYFDTKSSSTKQLSIDVNELQEGEVELTCLSTIPAFVTEENEYGDVRNTSEKVIISEVKGPAVSSPVEAKSSANSISVWYQLIILHIVIFYSAVRAVDFAASIDFSSPLTAWRYFILKKISKILSETSSGEIVTA